MPLAPRQSKGVQMTAMIESNLIQNALDYLILAGEQAETDQARMLKHAIANLGDGIELLLKARLEVYDWSLTFRNVDDANRIKYAQGDFKSVDLDQAVKRLRQICEVAIDADDDRLLKSLRKYRNRVRHFGISAEKNTLMSILVKVYNFAIDFVKVHIEGICEINTQEQLTTLRRLLGRSEPFVIERFAAIGPELAKHDLHLECPKCLQPALCITDQGGQCLFCGHTCAGGSGAEEWVDHEYELGSAKEKTLRGGYLASCPQCGVCACVRVPDTRGEDGTSRWVCFSCGESGDYDFCTRCAGLFEYDEERGDLICGNCREDIGRSDD
jgi:hypothetical protein